MKNKTPLRDKVVKTRQRLLEATFEQIAAYGYHNVTVDRIAAAAGVSTGSAYRYFKNKKEMLLATIEYYYENIQELSKTQDSALAAFDSLEDMLVYVLEQFYAIHKKYYDIHEELESLRHSDADIKGAYDRILTHAIDSLLQKCPAQYQALPNLRERIYLAIELLESFAHTQMEEATCQQYDMNGMRALTIQAVRGLLTYNGKEQGNENTISVSQADSIAALFP